MHMLYVLHHRTGALMLSAADQDQVRKWGERQLGEEAKLASISEGVCTEAAPSVEKDGTGIGTGLDKGCRPVMGVRSVLSQDVNPEHGCSKTTDAPVTRPLPHRVVPTLH